MLKNQKRIRTQDKKSAAVARAAILEVVANQLRDNNPPETRNTYDRLLKQGTSSDDAKLMIGSVVACEIFAILKRGEQFNLKRFCEKLNRLPDEPFDD